MSQGHPIKLARKVDRHSLTMLHPRSDPVHRRTCVWQPDPVSPEVANARAGSWRSEARAWAPSCLSSSQIAFQFIAIMVSPSAGCVNPFVKYVDRGHAMERCHVWHSCVPSGRFSRRQWVRLRSAPSHPPLLPCSRPSARSSLSHSTSVARWGAVASTVITGWLASPPLAAIRLLPNDRHQTIHMTVRALARMLDVLSSEL